jgi:hypothetical protein
MPVVDVATVSSSSNILSIKSIMLLVHKCVEVETLLYLSANTKTVSNSLQDVGLLSSSFQYEYEINISVVRLREPSSKVYTSRVLLLFISSTRTSQT